jgi:virginiamycin B lyase
MRNARTAVIALAMTAAVMVGGAAPALAANTTVTRSGPFTEYSLPNLAPANPYDITQGPDGNLWFTMHALALVGRITPGGDLTEFPVPTDGGLAITVGPDNALWFTTQGGNVYRMTTDGVVTNTYTVPSDGEGIATGPDGRIWISGGPITRLNPATGAQKTFPIDGFSSGITAGPDGNMWFTNPVNFFNIARVGKISMKGAIREYDIPPHANGAGTVGTVPWGITAGPDGNLWFADQFDQFGRVTTGGDVTMFPAGPGSTPSDVAAGADGNLWFTAQYGSRIVRVTLDGVKTAFALPAPFAGPTGITAGPHKTVWFVEYGKNNIPSNRIGTMKVCSKYTGTTC